MPMPRFFLALVGNSFCLVLGRRIGTSISRGAADGAAANYNNELARQPSLEKTKKGQPLPLKPFAGLLLGDGEEVSNAFHPFPITPGKTIAKGQKLPGTLSGTRMAAADADGGIEKPQNASEAEGSETWPNLDEKWAQIQKIKADLASDEETDAAKDVAAEDARSKFVDDTVVEDTLPTVAEEEELAAEANAEEALFAKNEREAAAKAGEERLAKEERLKIEAQANEERLEAEAAAKAEEGRLAEEERLAAEAKAEEERLAALAAEDEGLSEEERLAVAKIEEERLAAKAEANTEDVSSVMESEDIEAMRAASAALAWGDEPPAFEAGDEQREISEKVREDPFADVEEADAEDIEMAPQEFAEEDALESPSVPLENDMTALGVAPASSPDAEAAEQNEQFEITLVKRPGDDLGVDVDDIDGASLRVVKIKEGLVKDWNDSGPFQRVQVGDRIIDINGIRDTPGMIAESNSNPELAMTIERGFEADSGETRNVLDDLDNAYVIPDSELYADSEPEPELPPESDEPATSLVLDCVDFEGTRWDISCTKRKGSYFGGIWGGGIDHEVTLLEDGNVIFSGGGLNNWGTSGEWAYDGGLLYIYRDTFLGLITGYDTYEILPDADVNPDLQFEVTGVIRSYNAFYPMYVIADVVMTRRPGRFIFEKS